MRTPRRYAAIIAATLIFPASLPAADDLPIADFEGKDYGKWKTTGEAFGDGPARGTLPGQMNVTGFLGKGLVNSFNKGDQSVGTLTSPPFEIQRKHVNFLIGGGAHAGKTCMNLQIDGKVVRTATGPNSESGGSERLDWESWDVAEFAGKKAVVQIVDSHRGGWGHINVDHIVQSDKPRRAEPAERKLKIAKRYLHIPVKTGGQRTRAKLLLDGKPVRQFDVELSTAADASFTAFVDVSAWKGKSLTFDAGRIVDGELKLQDVSQSDEIPNAEKVYKETHRPQFHFTSRVGWLNDPNGLVYYKGEWHLFYQHNPYGWNWGNMHWGHAVSSDLLHWKELGDKLFPWADAKGACFSGSALVDAKNTAGFKTGNEDVLVAAFTDTGAGEAIAYSNDRGRTWTLPDFNPVVKHRGRDPKVEWHAPTNRWVMAVYNEREESRGIAFHTSTNLKDWKFESRIAGYYECPDLFELPVDGDAKNSKWVLHAADGKYVLGRFDGRKFEPEHEGKRQVWYGNFYAPQSYSNAPDNRRVQIGWARGVAFPGMPFNQQMTVPVDLTLRNTDDGVRMFAEPAPELKSLRAETKRLGETALGEEPASIADAGELLDVTAEFRPGKTGRVVVRVRGQEVVYDAGEATLICGATAPLKPEDGVVTLRILADRGSVEVFGNSGRVALSHGVLLDAKKKDVDVFTRGGKATLLRLESHRLNSVWKK